MTTAAFDPRMGASGDMLLGALLDAGADPAVLSPIEDAIDVHFRIEEVVDRGIAATDVTVEHHHAHHDHGEGAGPHRSFAEVVDIVEGMGLEAAIEHDAIEAFRLLGEAEATVHGTEIESTHFHEVGADDAIADVTGSVALLDDLGIERVLTTPIATGTGEVEMSHGTYPIPPPAVVEIASRSGLQLRGGPVEAELLTPTGAAILGSSATPVTHLPPMSVEAIGYGAGQRSFPDRPNVLRALVGESRGELEREAIAVLETNVDDATPEVIGHLQERLRAVGALDVSATPLTMKKSRPGHLIRVIADPADEARIARALAEETGTLGVRSVPATHRWLARRDVKTVSLTIDGRTYELDVKIARDTDDTVIDCSTEYDDAARVANATPLPVREVMRRAESAAGETLEPDGG